jgi:nicotinamide riboside kinase
MKIYLIGSASSGKSTLARYISEKYNLPRINEIARTVLAEREANLDQLRTNLDFVDSFQEEIFYRQLAKEAEQTSSFVSDRSFDCLIYSAQFARNFSQLLNTQEFKDYIKVLQQPNSILFFVRPSKETLKQDGTRETLIWENLVAFDAMVKMMLEMFNLNYFQINTTNMQERIRLIDSVINLSQIGNV